MYGMVQFERISFFNIYISSDPISVVIFLLFFANFCLIKSNFKAPILWSRSSFRALIYLVSNLCLFFTLAE